MIWTNGFGDTSPLPREHGCWAHGLVRRPPVYRQGPRGKAGPPEALAVTELREGVMGGRTPEKKTLDRAKKDRSEGKSPSTQAGEFVREEFDHIREGKHGARSAKQAIAIGLSKARRAGVDLPAPAANRTTPATRAKAKRDLKKGKQAREFHGS